MIIRLRNAVFMFILAGVCLLAACSGPGSGAIIDFETPEGLPAGWMKMDPNGSYSIQTDPENARHGNRSLLLEYVSGKETRMHSVMAMLPIPVDFSGSEVELSGYIKTEALRDGICGLYIRAEGDPGWTEIDGMRKEKISGTTDWKHYTVKVPLKKGAQDITIGVYHTGRGKVWFDQLEIRVDGKALAAANRRDLPPAKRDTAFRNGTGIQIGPLSPQSIDNLVLLGKVWGFLKYYHPAIVAGGYNWDAELFRILPAVLPCTDKQQRNQVLLQWIAALPPFHPDNSPSRKDTSEIKHQPDLQWLADKVELGDSLAAVLTGIRHAARGDRYYYMDIQSDSRPAFTNEIRYPQAEAADDGYRLLALFRYWNIVQYYFPYKHLIGEEWTAVLKRFVPVFVKAEDAPAYHLALQQLVCSIQDGHAYLQGNTATTDLFFGKYAIPADVRYVEGKPVVMEYPGDSTGVGLKRGDVILKVNGMPATAISERLRPYIAASNMGSRMWGVATKLLRGQDSLMTVEVVRDNRLKVLKLTGYSEMDPRRYKALPERAAWTVLPEHVGFVQMGALQKSQVPDMMKRFLSVKGIIIDLRQYPREMLLQDLCGYLTSSGVPYFRTYIPSVTEPGEFRFMTTAKLGGGNRYPYLGKIMVLVNEQTESRGEFFAMGFAALPNATIIGSATAGVDGDATEFYLPGGWKTRITGTGICWPDGRETQREGVIPDVTVKPTLKGVREGRDEVLEAAISRLK